VRLRSAEERHHSVADELLHPAAETLELRPEVLVIWREERTHVLGVERFGARRESDKVGEQNGDDLPLLAPCPTWPDVEGRGTRAAESETLRILLPAARANEHPLSL
jgi:hypothetical protein